MFENFDFHDFERKFLEWTIIFLQTLLKNLNLVVRPMNEISKFVVWKSKFFEGNRVSLWKIFQPLPRMFSQQINKFYDFVRKSLKKCSIFSFSFWEKHAKNDTFGDFAVIKSESCIVDKTIQKNSNLPPAKNIFKISFHLKFVFKEQNIPKMTHLSGVATIKS